MVKQDLATSLGGRVRFTRFIVSYKDVAGVAGSGAQPLTLTDQNNPSKAFVIPAGGKILGVSVKTTVAFAGVNGTLTALTVSLGVTGATTRFTSAYDIFQAVADTTIQETALFKAGQASQIAALILTLTPTTDVLANVVAGSMNIDLFWLDVSTAALPA